MVRYLAIIGLFFVSSVSAQEEASKHLVKYQEPVYFSPGLLECSATLSPGIMLNRSDNNFYVSGFLEYHFDRKLSVRSDNFLFVSSNTEMPFVQQAFRSYIGMFYHWEKNNWDKHIGFQPGVTFMQSAERDKQGDLAPMKLVPSFAITAGTSLYVWKYFNFFANLQYTRSKLSGTFLGPQQVDELFISVGLGFQIATRN